MSGLCLVMMLLVVLGTAFIGTAASCDLQCTTTAAYAGDDSAASYCQEATYEAACDDKDPAICEFVCPCDSGLGYECTTTDAYADSNYAISCPTLKTKDDCDQKQQCEYTCVAECGTGSFECAATAAFASDETAINYCQDATTQAGCDAKSSCTCEYVCPCEDGQSYQCTAKAQYQSNFAHAALCQAKATMEECVNLARHCEYTCVDDVCDAGEYECQPTPAFAHDDSTAAFCGTAANGVECNAKGPDACEYMCPCEADLPYACIPLDRYQRYANLWTFCAEATNSLTCASLKYALRCQYACPAQSTSGQVCDCLPTDQYRPHPDAWTACAGAGAAGICSTRFYCEQHCCDGSKACGTRDGYDDDESTATYCQEAADEAACDDKDADVCRWGCPSTTFVIAADDDATLFELAAPHVAGAAEGFETPSLATAGLGLAAAALVVALLVRKCRQNPDDKHVNIEEQHLLA